MRRFAVIALLLLSLPLAVVWWQYRSTYRDEGARADYLEIEEPATVDPHHPALRRGGVPILCYHYLRGTPGPVYFLRVLGAVLFNLPTLKEREYWTTRTELFERQMQWLVDHGYTTIDLDELADILEGKTEGPSKPVVITFDDGDRSVERYALPVLRRRKMKATILVVTSKVGRRWQDVATLDWDELKGLEQSGVFEVESHTHDMHYKVKSKKGRMTPVFLAEVPDKGPPRPQGEIFVRMDLRESRRILRDRLGHAARWLAWPYGWASSTLDSLARREGYRGSLSLAAGTNRPGRDSTWHLSRITITARTGMQDFIDLMLASSGEDLSDSSPRDEIAARADPAATTGAPEAAGSTSRNGP